VLEGQPVVRSLPDLRLAERGIRLCR
jgi:hypothetical protein